MKKIEYCAEPDDAGARIDKWISLSVPELSRSYIQKCLKDGCVAVNGKLTVKPSYRVDAGDEIVFEVPDASVPDIEPEDIPLDIIYEDEDMIVVNKPKGMVVHPAPGHYSGTLVNAVMYHCRGQLSGINGVMRPGIVHRIDRDTTGSVMICKNDDAHRSIAAQLEAHTINRLYHAIVWNNITDDEGTVTGAIGRDPSDRKKMAVVDDEHGKSAVTHYRVLKRFGQFTYVECRLETGRTHQIRVHMSHIGHPLLGDTVYGGSSGRFCLEGQCLHAKTLGFIHPRTGEYIETDAPLPEYFRHLLDIL
jgi:23S rRNA pseudouridine1911/1915/1917 synthase